MKKCEHANTKTEIMPEGSPHYAKMICADCAAFLGWRARPENEARRKQNRERIEQLNGLPCTEWEKSFLESIAKLDGKLSPKQQEKLTAIFEARSR